MRLAQLHSFLEVPFDESGRFVMPGHLAQLGGLGDEAYFNGNGPFFTIWTPDALMTMGAGLGADAGRLRALAEEAHAPRRSAHERLVNDRRPHPRPARRSGRRARARARRR